MIAPPTRHNIRPGRTASTAAFLLVALAAPARAADGAWAELAPPCRAAHSVIYDPVRDRLLLFGGSDGQLRNDVWSLSLSGTPHWMLLHPAGFPPSPRQEHTAVYDPVGDRMLVFGGDDGSPRADLWQLTFSPVLAWTPLAPVGSPPAARNGHSAVYDPLRHRMIVFGGQTAGGGVLNDVWALALDGNPAWSPLAPAGTAPQARARQNTIYDAPRDRLVIFGGDQGSLYQVLGDTWALSLGTSPAWTLIVPSGAGPDARSRAHAIYDPNGDRMVLQGGSSAPSFMTYYDYWTLSLSTNQWTSYGFNAPLIHAGGAAYDAPRARMLIVGGGYHTTTFLSDVVALPLAPIGQWSNLLAGTAPLADQSAAFDPVRERMVVFGGLVKGFFDPTPVNGAWSYDPNQSTLEFISAPGVPPPLHAHTAVFDASRDRMLVFGGDEVYGASPVHNDVWSLGFGAGPAWAHLAPTGTPPPPRCQHTAVIEPTGDRMIVFGGSQTGLLEPPSLLNDAWALSLSSSPAWTQLLPAGTPPTPRQGHSAVFDLVGQRMVVFGGVNEVAILGDVWELSIGATPKWNPMTPAGTPPGPRFGHAAIYDPDGQRMLVFGGYTSTGTVDELWALSLGPTTPTWTRLQPDGASPGRPYEGSAVYDPQSRHMLVAMGYGASGVWAFEPPGSVSIGPPIWPPAFALRGAVPNPAVADLVVAFTLPDGAPARLELFDTAGRRLESRDVGMLGPGAHQVTLAGDSRLPAGIYLVRLTRAGRSISVRAAVVR